MNWLHTFLRRPFVLTFHMRHGGSFSQRCQDWSVTASRATGDLTAYSMSGTKGETLEYIRLDDVVAISQRKVWL